MRFRHRMRDGLTAQACMPLRATVARVLVVLLALACWRAGVLACWRAGDGKTDAGVGKACVDATQILEDGAPTGFVRCADGAIDRVTDVWTACAD